MASMHTVIITNVSGSEQTVEDLGIIIDDSTNQFTISDYYTYDELACSDDLREFVGNGDFEVNDGSDDLSASDGVKYLTIDNLYDLESDYYSAVELSTSGLSAVHWDNITNAPSFTLCENWLSPVEYRVVQISSSAPGGPSIGDVYIDTDDNHYYKYDGSWQDEGVASSGDRVINLADLQEDIYTFNGSIWNASDSTSADNAGVVVEDDGDGNAAIYVYNGNTDTWEKIADLDFSGHLDGGASKHDASEIDVEGTYSNISGTPTDLENTISAIDTALGTALDHNTLDEAYDEGGAGSGRVITADSGPVKIDRGSSTDASFEIVPKGSLPTTNLSDGQIDNKGGILCVYDGTRSKFLSIARPVYCFGRAGTTWDQYLNFFVGYLASNNAGLRMVRAATIVSLTAQLDASGSCTFYIRKNDSATTVTSLTISGSTNATDTTLNVDLSAGDFLQCYINSVGTTYDPVILVELAWRP